MAVIFSPFKITEYLLDKINNWFIVLDSYVFGTSHDVAVGDNNNNFNLN